MSPWEQKAAQLDVEYMPWTPPNHGPSDRAHFNYQEFTNDAMRVEAEAAQLRDQVGIAPHEPQARPAASAETSAEKSERQAKLDRVSDFLVSMEAVLPTGS